MSTVVPASPANVGRAAQLLRAGELVSFPTETVYGLGADAGNESAVEKIFAAKGRPADHPLIVHLPDDGLLAEWVSHLPVEAEWLAERFWPGPLTMILPAAASVSRVVTGGQDTVGLRVPGHPLALQLLREFGRAIAAPSANRFGRVSPTSAEHVARDLGDAVKLILDGGPSRVGVESTIVDLSGAGPRLLRPGGVPRKLLAEVLGELPELAGSDAPRVSGSLPSHYAPRSPLLLLERSQLEARLAAASIGGEGYSVLALGGAPDDFPGRWRRMPTDPIGYARELFGAMRELDDEGATILVERPPVDIDWEAVNDRLERAAAREEEM